MFMYYDTMIGCYENGNDRWMEYDNVRTNRSFFARLLGMR